MIREEEVSKVGSFNDIAVACQLFISAQNTKRSNSSVATWLRLRPPSQALATGTSGCHGGHSSVPFHDHKGRNYPCLTVGLVSMAIYVRQSRAWRLISFALSCSWHSVARWVNHKVKCHIKSYKTLVKMAESCICHSSTTRLHGSPCYDCFLLACLRGGLW